MSDDQAFDRAIDDWLADGSDRTPRWVVDAVLLAVRTARQERVHRIPWRIPPKSVPLRIAAGLAILAIIGLAAMNAPSRGTVGSPTPSPTPGTSSSIIWTPNAVTQDWPGPLRMDADGGAPTIQGADFMDATGDSGVPNAIVDITHVDWGPGARTRIGLQLRGGLTTVPDPSISWIAYGVVVDLDGDGQGDQRIGIDNTTADHREWITDLATGQTAVNAGPTYGAFEGFGTRLETWFVDADGLATVVVKRTAFGFRFYAWASMIRDGVVVATDFAPDAGWIDTVSD